jgi:hypothetical protein
VGLNFFSKIQLFDTLCVIRKSTNTLFPLLWKKERKELANTGLKFKSHPHKNSAPKKSKEKQLSQNGLSYHT